MAETVASSIFRNTPSADQAPQRLLSAPEPRSDHPVGWYVRRDRVLRRANDFYAVVLGLACHDLRQPLQAIMAAHDLLAPRLGPGPEHRQLERIGLGATILAEELKQLTDLLHIHRHAGAIEPQPIGVEPVLRRLGPQLAGLAREKRIELRILPTRVVVASNAVLLEAMLRNLVRNALEHTGAGGRVVVGCRRRRGRVVRVEVHDNGGGIPQDSQAKIFEPFYRLDAASTAGLGLGLFIVKHAAECLEHRVEVRSTPGRGSCFAIVASVADAVRAE
jgi:two-component system phosphate regulon sensor histidine kinase PhoR